MVASATGIGFFLFQIERVRPLGALACGTVGFIAAAALAIESSQNRVEAERYRLADDALFRARSLPQQPYQAIATLANLIARNEPSAACSLFNEPGQQAFASAWNATDCPTAVRNAHSRIIDARLYEYGRRRDSITTRPAGPHGVDVDGCHLTWTTDRLGELLTGPTSGPPLVAGPQLGIMTVIPTGLDVGWIGSDFRRCP